MISFDVVVIGGGPGGERAAIQAARAGKRVALVERENVVGGMRVNWGTIPSKTLRESALLVHGLRHNKLDAIKVEIADTITIPELMYREQRVVQRELELINRSLTRYAIEVYRGEGRFLDAHTIAVHGVDGQVRLRLSGEVIVIATGSSPNRPADIDFDDDTVFDSTTVLRLPRMPRSMIVLGAGVIGVEYASIFAALGLSVTLVDTRADLLPFVDREIAGLLRQELGRLGVVFVSNDHYARVERIDGAPPTVRVTTRSGNVLEADVLLLLRRPRRQLARPGPRSDRHRARRARAALGQREVPDRASAHLRRRRRDRIPGPGEHVDGAGAPGDPERLRHSGAEAADGSPAVRDLRDSRGELRRRHRGDAEGEGDSVRRRTRALRDEPEGADRRARPAGS